MSARAVPNSEGRRPEAAVEGEPLNGTRERQDFDERPSSQPNTSPRISSGEEMKRGRGRCKGPSPALEKKD